MVYRKLYTTVIVRVIGIVINCLLLAFVWFHYDDVLLILNILIALALQTFFFIRKMNRLNSELETFFKAIRNSDTTVRFTNKQNDDYLELHKQLDLVNKHINTIKIENENQNQYFKLLVEHVGIGLLSYDSEGKVTLFNKAAKELFAKTQLYHINDLDRIQYGFGDYIRNIEPSEQKLLSLYLDHELVQLSVKASVLKMTDQHIKLISFQNIKNELDNKELDSWQKLIRVLTHEIMNSISPVKSSISTLVDLYTDQTTGTHLNQCEVNREVIEDTVEGLDIIEERITGIVNFVSQFRDLTLLPTPVFKDVNLYLKIQTLLKLMKDELNEKNIELTFRYPKSHLVVKVDPGMIDQIFINLMKNSIQALEQQSEKRIEVRIGANNKNRPFVELEDNGCGIAKEYQSEVFVPFFTSKKNGAGIGLSLSRQLIHLNGGSISFKSEPMVYTQFTIQF